MNIPIPIVILLGVLALPTLIFILAMFNEEMRSRGRCFIGNVDQYNDDGSYTIDTHILYVRIWRESGFHSTAWLD